MGFHEDLRDKGIGAKDWINSFTEIEYLGKGKFGASITTGNRVFKDKSDNKWKKHKLTDDRPAKDYVLVQSAKCCVEVYPYYAKYYDVNHEEVRLYEERWVVQRLFKEPDEWRDVDAYNPVITVEEYPEPAGDVVKVTVTYDSDYGIMTVEYFQRDGNALKHNITFKNTSGSEETFRVLQRWAGITGNKVKVGNDVHPITSKRVVLGLSFIFGDDSNPFGLREDQWGVYRGTDYSMDLERAKWDRQGACDQCGACCKAFNCQYYDPDLPDKCGIHIDKMVQQWKSDDETFQEWIERKDPRCVSCFSPVLPCLIENFEQCGFSFEPKPLTEETKIPYSFLYAVVVDVHPSGLKCDFVFGKWFLAQNENLVIDPGTATLDDPTEDGYLRRQAATEGDCPTGALDRLAADINVFLGGYATSVPSSQSFRGYVEWDISSIPIGVTITDTVFKYHGTLNGATDEEINPLTEEQPSDVGCTDAELWGYIASGTAYVDPWNFVFAANQSQDLGASADSDLQAAVDAAQGWFALGFQSPDDECPTPPGKFPVECYSSFYSEDKTDAPTPKPTLYVEYTPPAVPANPLIGKPLISPDIIKKAIIR